MRSSRNINYNKLRNSVNNIINNKRIIRILLLIDTLVIEIAIIVMISVLDM